MLDISLSVVVMGNKKGVGGEMLGSISRKDTQQMCRRVIYEGLR